MNELLEILHPSYVLRNALYGGVLTGLVLPLIGVLMYARRMVFLGIALPQVSATGIVAAIFYHIVFHQGAGNDFSSHDCPVSGLGDGSIDARA